MKLSPTQAEIVRAMQEGGHLHTTFGFRSDPGSSWLTKAADENGGRVHVSVRFPSIWVLEKLGILRREQRPGGNEYFLTEQGKDLKI